MTAFELDDHGAFARLAASLVATGAAMGARAFALTRTYGVRLQGQVKSNAAGRPGPRIQTGDYNRSIGLTTGMSGGAVEARVGTNRPQGRRLELGFDGIDSLGRAYAQPPYPHFGPALDKLGPEFEQAGRDLAQQVLEDGVG